MQIESLSSLNIKINYIIPIGPIPYFYVYSDKALFVADNLDMETLKVRRGLYLSSLSSAIEMSNQRYETLMSNNFRGSLSIMHLK